MWPFKNKEKRQNKVSFAVIDPKGGTIIWSEDDYTTYAKETYLQNVIAYQCINQIARSVASVPWKLMKGEGKDATEIENWKMKKVFVKPNIFESFERFLYKGLCYYMIKGDSYVWRGRVVSKSIPQEFIALRPDYMSIKQDSKGYPTKYIYQFGGEKEEYEVDPLTGDCDILHIKSFHPLNDLYGMPAVKPASREIDISNASTHWNMRLMQNEARPGMIVMMNGFLTEDQFKNLENQLKDHSGFDKAGKNLILESEGGIIDVKPYSWSPKDIDFLEGGRETARRICIGFGVPPMLLGIPGDNTYSNYKEARAAFWEDTCNYYLNLFISEFSCWLFGTGDEIKYGESGGQQLTLEADLSKVPALSYKQDQLWERQASGKDVLTTNERRGMIGYEPIEGGDVILVGAGQIPIEFAAEPIPPDDEVEEETEEEEEIEEGEE